MGSVYRPTRRDPATGQVIKYQTYRIVYNDEHGQRRTEKAFRDKAASEALLRRRIADVERRKAGLSVVNDTDRQRDYAQAVEGYAAELRRLGRGETHVKNAVSSLTRTAQFCGWLTIGQIRADGLTRYLAHRAAQGSAPRTANADRDYLAHFVDWLVGQGWLGENPIRAVPKAPAGGKHRRRRRRAYTPDELAALLNVPMPPERRLAYALAAASGLRRIELARLQWCDIDTTADRPLWRLRPEVSKNGLAWTVPMTTEAAQALDELRLLPRDRGGAAIGRTSEVFRRLPRIRTLNRDLARAGVAKRDAEGRQVDFHAFRYFFCSQLARSMPVQKVRALMRHTTLKQTCDLYLQLGLDDLAEDVWSLPALGGLTNPPEQLGQQGAEQLPEPPPDEGRD